MIGSGVGMVSFGNEFYNPPTPVNIPVRGFSDGSRLRVVLMPTNGPRFHVNLHTPGDIALHFNSRFDEQAIVANSTQGGGWMAEERYSQPFQPNHVYTLEFSRNNGIIHMTVNGQFFADFVERVPSHGVHNIEIGGDVHVHSAHVTH